MRHWHACSRWRRLGFIDCPVSDEVEDDDDDDPIDVPPIPPVPWPPFLVPPPARKVARPGVRPGVQLQRRVIREINAIMDEEPAVRELVKVQEVGVRIEPDPEPRPIPKLPLPPSVRDIPVAGPRRAPQPPRAVPRVPDTLKRIVNAEIALSESRFTIPAWVFPFPETDVRVTRTGSRAFDPEPNKFSITEQAYTEELEDRALYDARGDGGRSPVRTYVGGQFSSFRSGAARAPSGGGFRVNMAERMARLTATGRRMEVPPTTAAAE